VTDPARTITLTIPNALRIAELLDYLSDMAEHAGDHIDDADERKELFEERLSARYWAKELREMRKALPITRPTPFS
jgi:hypothetical protein